MNNIYESIRKQMLSLGIDDCEVDKFMYQNEFAISFGEMDVWENVNRECNPKLVKRKGMSIAYKNKNKDVVSGIIAEL